jgi:hypothetical protein
MLLGILFKFTSEFISTTFSSTVVFFNSLGFASKNVRELFGIKIVIDPSYPQ